MEILPAYRSSKQEREHHILIGLVEYYLKTGKPVGSNTLKEQGFNNISSATIRNYFSKLEEEGYLIQHHTSGGRVPTNLAFRLYAREYIDSSTLKPEESHRLHLLRIVETREIASYLQTSAQTLSDLTQAAVFFSAPRFDHDYVVDIKLVPIDAHRCLCVIVTDFGLIKTEIVQNEAKLSAFAAKRIEAYFKWRLTGHDKPENLEPDEEALALKIYNEIMVRYIVNYSNFIDTELFKTGFSKLLSYSEFHDPSLLAASLGLFENNHFLQRLIKECSALNSLCFWIGDDLLPHTSSASSQCAMILIPYYINKNIAGVVGLLTPIRIPYRDIFAIIREFSSCVTEALTRNLYKFKIAFRQPHTETKAIENKPLSKLLMTKNCQ